MRELTVVETFDGIRHSSQKKAMAHLDKLYADKLFWLVHKTTVLLKPHRDLPEFINDNLDKFIELKRIKQDYQMEDD